MKRFVTVAFSCCLLGGVIVGLGIAQDQTLDPFAQREPDAPRERDSDRRESEEDVERDERAAHVNELRAEIRRVQEQFAKAKAEGNEDQLRELGQFLEKLHVELRNVKRHLHESNQGKNEHGKHDELAGHAEEIRKELGHLEERFVLAREEGKEEKARELQQHMQELGKKLRHIEAELHGGDRDGREDQHAKRGEFDRGELEEAAEAIEQELHRLEELSERARNEGQEEKARGIARHIEDLHGKLEVIGNNLGEHEHGDREHAEDRERGEREYLDGEEREKLEYFHEVLVKQLKQNEQRLEEAQENGREEEVDELAQHQENLFLKLREVEAMLEGEERPHREERGHDEDERHARDHDRQGHDDLEARLEHLHIAIEHLKAGGFEEIAHHAISVAERIDREIHGEEHAREHEHEHEREREHVGREEIVHKVRQLEEHLHHLHEELEHVKRVLERTDR